MGHTNDDVLDEVARVKNENLFDRMRRTNDLTHRVPEVIGEWQTPIGNADVDLLMPVVPRDVEYLPRWVSDHVREITSGLIESLPTVTPTHLVPHGHGWTRISWTFRRALSALVARVPITRVAGVTLHEPIRYENVTFSVFVRPGHRPWNAQIETTTDRPIEWTAAEIVRQR